MILISLCLGTINATNCDDDFCIGAFFDIKVPYEPSMKCEKIHEVYGIQRVEAALMAIESIKRNKKILPGVTLGINIQDTCRTPSIALYKTLFLIRSGHINNMNDMIGEHIENRMNADTFNLKKRNSTIIGVVGPATADECTQVQNLLKLFNIPHIGYSDTEPIINDRSRNSTFIQVLPCNSYQANIIHDILKLFNWRYISVIYNSDNRDAMQTFRYLTEIECKKSTSPMCIDTDVMIESYHDDEFYNAAIDDLAKEKKVNVIICFCDGDVLRKVFQAIKKWNLTDRFTIVASDSWENRDGILHDLEEQVWGSIFVRINSPSIPEFSKHYKSLKPSTTTANKWFNEFWMNKFNCTLVDNLTSENDINSNISKVDTSELFESRQFCTGNESLATNYLEQRKIDFVMKAIWTMAHGLHNMITEICGENYIGICPQLMPFNHSKLVDHLKNLTFNYGDEVVTIDQDGYLLRRYEIQNFQKLPNNTFEYKHIGDYVNKSLVIYGKYQSKGYRESVTSICSKPCSLGYRKTFERSTTERSIIATNTFGRRTRDRNCCWDCESCSIHEYVSSDKEHCIECHRGERPNANRTGCDKIPYLTRNWTEPTSIMVVCFTTTGLFFTLITFCIFRKYKRTPIVKCSSWELTNLIIFSMILAHVSVFIIMTTPTTLTCALSRSLPGISFAMMFASLFTKTRRISRILAYSKKKFPKKRHRLLSTSVQVAISLFYASLEAVICFIVMIINPPTPQTDYSPEGYPVFNCAHSPLDVLVPSALLLYLLVLCSIYAIKVRNVPGNFNEAKFIGFGILICCIIWIAFYPIFFWGTLKAVTFSMCITLTASMMMVFLFFPKLYIIIFKSEINNRAQFITNKSIRTHVGTHASKKSGLDEFPIYIIPEEIFENSGQSCRLRNVAVQTSTKLLRNLNSCYDQHEISSMAQIYSSSDDDEFTGDDDNCLDSQHDNVNTLEELSNNKRINWQTNDIIKSENKQSSVMTVELLNTKLKSLQAKRETNLKNKIPSVTTDCCAELNIINLLQKENTRRSINLRKRNLELTNSENIPKEVQQSVHQEKHTRIHEEQTHKFHNGDPIFNITITLSSES